MNFYNFQSIVGAKKVAFQMRAPSDSFYEIKCVLKQCVNVNGD
jgi:hypothetical protein